MKTLAAYQIGWRILINYGRAGHYICDDGTVILRPREDDYDMRDKLREEIANSGDC